MARLEETDPTRSEHTACEIVEPTLAAIRVKYSFLETESQSRPENGGRVLRWVLREQNAGEIERNYLIDARLDDGQLVVWFGHEIHVGYLAPESRFRPAVLIGTGAWEFNFERGHPPAVVRRDVDGWRQLLFKTIDWMLSRADADSPQRGMRYPMNYTHW